MFYTVVLFILAGLAEIGGGYLIWLWIREGKPYYWGILGGATLALYGLIATFQSSRRSVESMLPTEGFLSFYLYCGDGLRIGYKSDYNKLPK